MDSPLFSKWVNTWPSNPTQNMYSRAVKIPQTGMESEFSRQYDAFKHRMTLRGFQDDNPFSKEYGR